MDSCSYNVLVVCLVDGPLCFVFYLHLNRSGCWYAPATNPRGGYSALNICENWKSQIIVEAIFYHESRLTFGQNEKQFHVVSMRTCIVYCILAHGAYITSLFFLDTYTHSHLWRSHPMKIFLLLRKLGLDVAGSSDRIFPLCQPPIPLHIRDQMLSMYSIFVEWYLASC